MNNMHVAPVFLLVVWHCTRWSEETLVQLQCFPFLIPAVQQLSLPFTRGPLNIGRARMRRAELRYNRTFRFVREAASAASQHGEARWGCVGAKNAAGRYLAPAEVQR